MDDLWRLRLRRDAFLLPPGRGPASGGCPSFIGKVISTGGNLGVNKYCKVNPVDATGTETESAAGTLTAAASTVVVLALGPTAPATGDYLVCRYVNYRWVADQQTAGGGAGTVTLTGCCGSPPTPVPTTLNLTVSNVTPSGCGAGANFVNATLTYQPVGTTSISGDPGACSAIAGFPGLTCPQAWWSPLLEVGKPFCSYCSVTPGDPALLGYHYALICSSNIGLYILCRCNNGTSAAGKAESVQGWNRLSTGNSCSPFLMTNPNLFAHASSISLGNADIVISG